MLRDIWGVFLQPSTDLKEKFSGLQEVKLILFPQVSTSCTTTGERRRRIFGPSALVPTVCKCRPLRNVSFARIKTSLLMTRLHKLLSTLLRRSRQYRKQLMEFCLRVTWAERDEWRPRTTTTESGKKRKFKWSINVNTAVYCYTCVCVTPKGQKYSMGLWK